MTPLFRLSRWQKVVAASCVAALPLVAACKSEAPKPADDKKSSPVPAYTPYVAPSSSPNQSSGSGNGSGNGNNDEDNNGEKAISATGCTDTECKSPGTLKVQVDGNEVSQLSINPTQTTPYNVKVVSTKYEERPFKIHLDLNNSTALAIAANDAETASVQYQAQNANTGARSGSITVRALDTQKCEKAGESNCDDPTKTSSFTEDLTLNWSSDGSTVASNGTGSTGSSSSDVGLVIGLQILSQMLGFGGGNQQFINGPNGANNGFFGGGIGNGFGGNQWGNNGQQQFAGNQWGGNGFGANQWGQQTTGGVGGYDQYGNQVVGGQYDINGNYVGSNGAIGNQFGQQGLAGAGGYDQYGNRVNGGQYDINGNYVGTSGGLNNGLNNGLNGCSVSNCSVCTASQCTSVGCRYVSGYCQN